MPYAPIRDAHRLHRSISEPDILPQSYDETIKSQLVGDLGEVQVQGVEEEDEDDVEVWNERQGAIPLYSLGVTINFTVMNYGLLWAKAEKFCTFLFICDAFSYLLSRLTFCEQHLHCPSTTLLNTLQADLQHSKLQLIFAMYLEDSNPHDVIYSFFREMHAEVYLNCVHCDTNVVEDEKLDPPDTMLRLYDALYNAGLFEHVNNHSIKKSQVDLMNAQGLVEDCTMQFHAMRSFTEAKDDLNVAIQPILQEIDVVTRQTSVMGVPSFEPLDL